MGNFQENVKKICSFYVSDWHLISMLLPYISKHINTETKITNITEKDLEDKIKEFISKLNLNKEIQERILEMNWNKKAVYTYRKLDDRIKEEMIIISGNKQYIDKMNKNIAKYLNKIEKQRKVTIINCYEVMEFNENIHEILSLHDKILNTSGEKEIGEIFDGYQSKRDSAINE